MFGAVPCLTCIPHRYFIAWLSFFIMVIVVGYRTCFTLMVVHIVVSNSSNDDTAQSDGGSLFPNCTTKGTSRDRTVDWSGETVFLFQTSYFCGQFLMSIPAGALATRWSPKRIFGLTILATGVLQMLMPIASEAAVWLVFVIRAVQGLLEASFVPAMNAIISAWAPKSEKARLINIAYAGVYVSPAVANFATGATACYVSWDSIMYIYGSIGAFLCVMWLLFVFPTPATYTNILEEEQRLLQQQPTVNAASSASKTAIPWAKFFTSLPVWAIWVGAFCRNFVFAMLTVEIQQYYKDVYSLSTAMIGLLSGFPLICMAVFMIFGSVIFDQLIKKNILSVTKTRKLAQCLGFGIQGICILAIAFLNDHWQVFALFCVGVAFSGFAMSGYQTNPLDLAPQYVGPLTGISRTGMVGSIISTILASQITKSRTLKDWQNMFLITACIHIAGVIFYFIFASGEVQPWAQEEVRRRQTFDSVVGDNYDGGDDATPDAALYAAHESNRAATLVGNGVGPPANGVNVLDSNSFSGRQNGYGSVANRGQNV